MKKKYTKPVVVVETFQLNESIAACDTKVLFGPEKENPACGDYGFGEVSPFALRSVEVVPFYEYACTCYYTAPEGSGYFGNS